MHRLLGLLLLATPLLAQNETKRVSAGGISLTIPVAWKAEVARSDAALLRVNLVGTAPLHHIQVHPASEGLTRAAIIQSRARGLRARSDMKRVECREKPMPHMRAWYGEENLHISIPVLRQGNRYEILYAGTARDFEKREADIWAVATSLESRAPAWPPPVEGFEASTRKGVRWEVQPGVPSKQVKQLQKDFDRWRKRFEKTYGKLEGKQQVTPRFVVLREKSEFRAVSPEAAGVRGLSHCIPELATIVCAPPIGDRADVERARFAAECWQLCFVTRYGDVYPAWLYFGEWKASYNEASLGKPLPALTEASFAALPESFPLLREVLDCSDSLGNASQSLALLYVAWFRKGPGKARSAYKKFLDEYARTADHERAAQTHLAPLSELADRTIRKFRNQTLKPTRPK